MLENFIRNFFVYTVALFTFYKLLHMKPQNRKVHFFLLISTVVTSIFSAFLFNSNQSLNWIFILFIFFLTVHFLTQIAISLIYTTILFSFTLSFITFSLSAIIVVFSLLLFYHEKYEISLPIIRILVGSLHSALIYYCFRFPRLKNGMTFLYHIPFNNIGSAGCFFLTMIIILLCQPQSTVESFTLKLCTATFLFGFVFLYWWNYHITQTYRKFLRKNELDSLNLLLEERNQEILYLKKENDKLAGIIHKDNKIIPSLSMAIIDSYENNTELDLSRLECDSSLYTKLKQLYDERCETLEKYQQEVLHLPQTSFDSVNAVLSFMQSEALIAGVPYEVVLFDNLDSTIPAEIAENDFIHILSDLLANAVNACRDIPSASVRIYLGRMDGISTIKICNTGNVFDIDTLKNLGLVRHTTHADTSGSGIGLMDIWKLKEKYSATLLIDETVGTDSSSTYTCINILFNHKNHYIIQSNRYKELSTHINRPDIMIISKE